MHGEFPLRMVLSTAAYKLSDETEERQLKNISTNYKSYLNGKFKVLEAREK